MAGVGQSVRLHQDELKLRLAGPRVVLKKRVKRLDKVIFRRAADASVRHLIEVIDIISV